MKKMERYYNLGCIFVFLLALALRIFSLDSIPSGFHRDEAFLGYNAYSILKTGRDISGVFLPSHLSSFLYTPAGYAYLSIVWIVIFGLNVFSIRFASAFFGAISVLAVFYLVKEISLMIKLGENQSKIMSLLACCLFAVSPWHINLSRTASVITVVLFFILCGLVFLLRYFCAGKKSYLFIAYLCLTLSLSMYIAPYPFLLLFLPFVTLLFSVGRREMLITQLLFFVIFIVIPSGITFASSDLSLRARSLSIFQASETLLVLDEQIKRDGVEGTPYILTRIFHNKVQGYISEFLANYFSHFSYDFLFTDKNLPDRYRVPQAGLLYLIDLPFFFLGIWFLWQKNKRITLFLSAWLFFSPVGSALASDDVPNMQRTLFMIVPMLIFIAFGMLFFLLCLPRSLRLIAGVTVGIVYFLGVGFYLHQYFTHGPYYRPWYRQDGYKELVSSINSLLPRFEKAVVTNRESAPTIFFLFFSRYDPAKFQEEARRSFIKDYDRMAFGRFEFSQEECPLKSSDKKRITEKNVLYVNSGLCKIEPNVKVHKIINRTDGSKAFQILSLE
jgi:4-amino-4-deoxy-L-arabinose transferase-like glycosyltransferase